MTNNPTATLAENPTRAKTRNLERRRFDQFVVDIRVQRPLDQRRVKAMAASFDRDAVGVLVAWEHDGKLICLDGQHRAAAAQAANRGSELVDVEVWRGLDIPAAARLFRLYNATQKPTRVDLFNIALTEGEQTAVDCNRVLVKYNLSSQPGQVNSFVAPKTLEELYSRDGGLLADRVFWVLTSLWGARREAVRADLVLGFAAWIEKYQAQVNLELLINKLAGAGYTAAQMVAQGKSYAAAVKTTTAQGVAATITELWNVSKKQNRLPHWQV